MERVPYYLYAIAGSPSWMQAVKIGYYLGDVASLRSRYITAYGSDLDLAVFQVPDKSAAMTAERGMHAILKQTGLHITNELFHHEAWAVFITEGAKICQDWVGWCLTRTALEKRKHAEAKAQKKAATLEELAHRKCQQQHQLQHALDVYIHRFIQEHCEKGGDHKVKKAEFQLGFVRFCGRDIKQNVLEVMMTKRGFAHKQARIEGKKMKVYCGIRLL